MPSTDDLRSAIAELHRTWRIYLWQSDDDNLERAANALKSSDTSHDELSRLAKQALEFANLALPAVLSATRLPADRPESAAAREALNAHRDLDDMIAGYAG